MSKFTKTRINSTSFLVSNLVHTLFGLPALNPVTKVRQMLDIIDLKVYIASQQNLIKKLHRKGIHSLTNQELEILKSVDYARNLLRIKESSDDNRDNPIRVT